MKGLIVMSGMALHEESPIIEGDSRGKYKQGSVKPFGGEHPPVEKFMGVTCISPKTMPKSNHQNQNSNENVVRGREC